jgi:molybdopterin converting factor small subunit
VTRILFLGPAREAAGCREDDLVGETVAEVLAGAVERYGEGFEKILSVSQVWLNGASCSPDQVVGSHDEIAVLPPISGG